MLDVLPEGLKRHEARVAEEGLCDCCWGHARQTREPTDVFLFFPFSSGHKEHVVRDVHRMMRVGTVDVSPDRQTEPRAS